MDGGNQWYTSPLRPPGSNPPPRHGSSGRAPHRGGYSSPDQDRNFGGYGNPQRGYYAGGGYYNYYSSGMPQDFPGGGWQGPGNSYYNMPRPQGEPFPERDDHHGSSGPDLGIVAYDNIVTGDPRTVMIGQGNHAGGRVRGRISGNRVIRD